MNRHNDAMKLMDELLSDIYVLGSPLLYAVIMAAALIMERFQFFQRLALGALAVYSVIMILRSINMGISDRAALSFLLGFFVSDYYGRLSMKILLLSLSVFSCYALFRLKKEKGRSIVIGGLLGALTGSIFVIFRILEQHA